VIPNSTIIWNYRNLLLGSEWVADKSLVIFKKSLVPSLIYGYSFLDEKCIFQ